MTKQISFNSRTAEQKDFLMAKSRPEEDYRRGPIQVANQESFWVLASIIPDWDDEDVVAEDVRISFQKAEPSDKETVIACGFCGKDCPPQDNIAKIRFVSEEPFYLELQKGSALMYGPAGKWQGENGKKLSDDAFEECGALIGTDFVDGRIRGGFNNRVTVSIKVLVIRY